MREKGKEKESICVSSASTTATLRHLSPSEVKQNLIRLDKDGDTRRDALNSLKQCVEAMDMASVPRFLTQVSETGDKGASRAYAISLYEDVARVHGKLIIPHIPRVMTTITRTLSASGSSPQLQQACAKVVSTIVKHAIDEDLSAQANLVLRELCDPLLDALAGKLEPLAAGAAVCLQALVESEKWKFATLKTVEDLCLKTAVALAEKGTRTVAHMQLAQALASANSSLLSSYGVTLLRSGVEVVKAPSASGSWQQRASAARLLTAVLPTVDRATLSEELCSVVRALDGCKHDRMPNVRVSVKEALKVAKMLLAEENSRRAIDGEEPLEWVAAPSPESISSSSPSRRSLGGTSDDLYVAFFKKARPLPRHSPVSVIPVSPSTPTSRASFCEHSPRQERRRSPLRATRSHVRVASLDASLSGLNDFQSFRKENLPSLDSDRKAGVQFFDSGTSTLTDRGFAVKGGKHGRSRSLDTGGIHVEERSDHVESIINTETSSPTELKGRRGNPVSPQENVVTSSDRGEEGDLLPDHEERYVLSSAVGADVLRFNDEPWDPCTTAGGAVEKLDMRICRERSGSRDAGGNSELPCRGGHGLLDGSTMNHVFELKSRVMRSKARNVNTEICVKRSGGVGGNDESTGKVLSSGSNLCADLNEQSNFASPVEDNSLPKWKISENGASLEGKPLLGVEDFVQYSTPRRLVRSLQTGFSLSSSASFLELDSPLVGVGEQQQDVMRLRADEDMDLGTPTSSSTGWSVRTNPIASDESFQTGSDDDLDAEQERKNTWRTMVSDSPTHPAPLTPPVQETDNPEVDGFRHRLIHPEMCCDDLPTWKTADNLFSGSGRDFKEDLQPLVKATSDHLFSRPCRDFEEGLGQLGKTTLGLCQEQEIVKRAHQEGPFFISLPAQIEGFPNKISSEEDCVDKWSCADTQHSRRSNSEDGGGALDTTMAEMDEFTVDGVVEGGETVNTCSTSFAERANGAVGQLNCSNLSSPLRCWRNWTTVFLSGRELFFVVVATFPLVVTLYKVFFQSSVYHATLVPT